MLWALAAAALLGFGALGAWGGYASGIQDRLDYQYTQEAQDCQAQFDLGVADMADGRYDVARQRFEYVIQLCPEYPEVTGRLADTLLALNTTATATQVPTPTLTPTPDLRGAEELFARSLELITLADWSAALETLDTLRKKQPDYNPVEVDGMYYVALRNRGIEKIQAGNLEGGTYDLARAERFGPLDAQAETWRTWASLYSTGASFWEINWPQAINYFSDLALAAPNLRDLSGWTATDRLRMAFIGYGDQLALNGDFCNAQLQYEQALLMGPDATLEPTATQAARDCAPPTPRPRRATPTPEGQPTDDGSGGPTPTDSAPPPPTTAPPPAPSETPTPGP